MDNTRYFVRPVTVIIGIGIRVGFDFFFRTFFRSGEHWWVRAWECECECECGVRVGVGGGAWDGDDR